MVQRHLHLSNCHSHGPLPTDCRPSRTDNTTWAASAPQPRASSTAIVQLMLAELHSGFSGTPAPVSLPFPWQISAFSSQQPLLNGPKVAGRPFPQGLDLLFPDSPACTSQSRLPRRCSAADSAGPWLLCSSCLALVFLGGRKPVVTTSSSIYRHICIFVILFRK